MKYLLNVFCCWACTAGLLLITACGTGEKYKTGDDPGETNRANPTIENGDETGDGFTREYNDATQEAEEGPSPGADTTNTDSTQVTPRMGV